MNQISGPVVYVVATPIGNMGDISSRAISILLGCDLIAAEDTRRARKLLTALNIERKEIVSYHDHSRESLCFKILDRIQARCEKLVLISDAGTPLISDPGYRLIKEAHDRDIKVSPVPGPSSVMALSSVAGLPTDRILFVGFLDSRKAKKEAEIRRWKNCEASIVFFESMRRLEDTMKLVESCYPNAKIAIGRELTKLHEECKTFEIGRAIDWINSEAVKKGEIVIMVNINGVSPELPDRERLTQKARLEFKNGENLKDLLLKYGDQGFSRNELYEILVAAKKKV